MPDVPVWPACDEACLFCSNPEPGARPPKSEHSLEALIRRLGGYKAGLERFVKFNDARDALTLTGGEPTLHPRFVELLAALRRQFPAALIRLLTHGRTLSGALFADRVLRAAGEPFEVAVNLSGPGRGLERGLDGTANLLRLRGRRQSVVIRTVLTVPALENLGALADLLALRLRGLDGWAILFPELEGRAAREPAVHGLRMTGAARVLGGLLARLERAAPVSLYHFPSCALSPALRGRARATLDPVKVVFRPACGGCRLRAGCVGIHKSYARAVGTAEFPARALL
ncbi:MAG: radical SAM protein [Elusimicrobia bacterium]|nr:radical SAM protein [Elusimicrobiota bacterium]